MDVVKIGQEDEATPDPDGVPWEVAEEGAVEPDEAGGASASEDDSKGDGEIVDFDPDDWVAPPEVVTASCEQGVVPHHGDGDVGEVVARDPGESLSAEQADALLGHSSRLQALDQAKGILNGLGGSLGASLRDTVSRVIRVETKRFRARMHGDALVAKEMRASLEAEEARYRSDRLRFQEQMQQRKEKKRAAAELKDVAEQLKKARRDNRQAEAVAAARESIKSFSPLMLGQGKKKGGGPQFQKARFEVLERVRSLATLSPEQGNDWEYFKTSWDRVMAEAQGEGWADLFAEIVQHVVDELGKGDKSALSAFMHRETQRVLADIPALVLPGAA